jgi:ORF6N domain-containing protein
MFEMIKNEFSDWRSQFVTSKSDQMGLRYEPMVFTEQGVAMLSSVLKIGRGRLGGISNIPPFEMGARGIEKGGNSWGLFRQKL